MSEKLGLEDSILLILNEASGIVDADEDYDFDDSTLVTMYSHLEKAAQWHYERVERYALAGKDVRNDPELDMWKNHLKTTLDETEAQAAFYVLKDLKPEAVGYELPKRQSLFIQLIYENKDHYRIFNSRQKAVDAMADVNLIDMRDYLPKAEE